MYDYDDLNYMSSVLSLRRQDCDYITLRFNGDNFSEKTCFTNSPNCYAEKSAKSPNLNISFFSILLATS